MGNSANVESDDENAMDHELTQDAKKRSPPPIFLRSKANYKGVVAQAARKNIAFTKVQKQVRRHKIPACRLKTITGRSSTCWDNTAEQYHTFELASEKSLKVVIRGLPETITEADVKSELAHLGYPVRKVHRISVRGKTTPLVSVDLDRSDKGKEIFMLGRLLCLTCTKTKEDAPAKCANCHQEHTANYRGCPAFPKPRKLTQPRGDPGRSCAPTADTSGSRVTSTKSFASAVTGTPAPATAPPVDETSAPSRGAPPSASTEGTLATLLKIAVSLRSAEADVNSMRHPRKATNRQQWLRNDQHSDLVSTVHGLTAKRNELEAFLEEYAVDVMLVCETFLQPYQNPKIRNYELFRKDRVGPRGGNAIYVRRNLDHSEIDVPATQHLEANAIVLNTATMGPIRLIQGHRPDVIDIALLRGVRATATLTSISEMSSDHNPVILDLEAQATAHPDQERRRTDWTLFSERLEGTLGKLPIIESAEDLDEAVNHLTAAIQEAIHSASKTLPSGAKKSLPQEISQLLQERNRARRRWQRTADPADRLTANRLATRARDALREMRNTNWKNLIDQLEDSDRKMWRISRALKITKSPMSAIHGRNGMEYTAPGKAEAIAESLELQCSPTYNNADIDHIQRVHRAVRTRLREKCDGPAHFVTPAESHPMAPHRKVPRRYDRSSSYMALPHQGASSEGSVHGGQTHSANREKQRAKSQQQTATVQNNHPTADASKQSRILRNIANAPWYVKTANIHSDLGIEYITAMIKKNAVRTFQTLETHSCKRLREAVNYDEHEKTRHKRPRHALLADT
ncbi:hypothetical protein CBL_05137 [Carabus blaptoides fortunei]